MAAENSDHEAAAEAYETHLPDVIDLLLLGMGTDGHVASLFPDSSALRENQRSVVAVTSPKPPCERLTITPKVIGNAKQLFLLATGEEKGRILANALTTPEKSNNLPIRLTMRGCWLLDEEQQVGLTFHEIFNVTFI